MRRTEGEGGWFRGEGCVRVCIGMVRVRVFYLYLHYGRSRYHYSIQFNSSTTYLNKIESTAVGHIVYFIEYISF